MAEFPYLVAIALVEQNGERLMPIGGKSIKGGGEIDKEYQKEGQKLVSDILLRVIAKTDAGHIKRAHLDKSILLTVIDMELLQSKLPGIKSSWLRFGDSNALLKDLCEICERVWKVNYDHPKGICLERI